MRRFIFRRVTQSQGLAPSLVPKSMNVVVVFVLIWRASKTLMLRPLYNAS